MSNVIPNGVKWIFGLPKACKHIEHQMMFISDESTESLGIECENTLRVAMSNWSTVLHMIGRSNMNERLHK